ncbi:MAG: hypothetical protein RLZZ592_652 [Pseudomonadota bacterium]
MQLSDSGLQAVASLAARHGFSTEAVTTMLQAVTAGGGTMAQFSHPEFGGSGQWMSGGMLMLGDMFNHGLKSRVDSLCHELATLSATRGDLWLSAPVFGGGSAWWPADLGQPAASGSQNQLRYAWFPQARRLAVDSGGEVWIYDTLDHQIGGFSQQQGSGGGIAMSSQFGPVDLSRLPVVMRAGQAVAPEPAFAPAPACAAAFSPAPAPMPAPAAGGEDLLATIEKLGALLQRGLLTEQEFAAKKAELLSRL